jgi:hypothetical protein
VVAAWHAPAVAAAPTFGALPSPNQVLRAAPPVSAPQASFSEQRIPRRLRAREVVRVGVDAAGRPVRVVVEETLRVIGKGDYSFVVSAPVEDVRPLAGTESQPGLRTSGVVWQGFSPGSRTLAAAITLRPAPAAAGLPLRLVIDTGGIRLENHTAASTTTLASPVAPDALAGALDAVRSALAGGRAIGVQLVPITGPVRNESLRVVLPLRVHGVARFAGGAVPVRAVIGERPVQVRGSGRLRRLELVVAVPKPADLLEPPGAASWHALARRGGLASSQTVTRTAVRRLVTAALAAQFHAFLGNPVAGGTATSTYAYRLVSAVAAAPPNEHSSSGGWWVALVAALGGTAVAGAALLLWAHS